MPEACLGIDRSGRIRFLNQAAQRFLNVEPKAVLDKELWNVLPVSDFSRFLGSVVKSSHDQLREQFVLLPPDRAFLAQVVPVKSEDERLQGWCALLRDQSDVKKIERGLDQLFADVHQQIKLPLAAIKGYVETLLEGAYLNQDVTRRFLQVINEETNRLVRILLTLETNKPGAALAQMKESCDLLELLRQCAGMFSQRAAEKGIELTCELPSFLPPYSIQIDDFRGAVVNLIDNAIKCTALKGEGKVVLRATIRKKSVQIEVEDNGVGIAPEEQERIFERFYRVQLGPASELGGTGLGLSVAREAIEREGGSLEAASQPGRGACFTIQLPLR